MNGKYFASKGKEVKGLMTFKGGQFVYIFQPDKTENTMFYSKGTYSILDDKKIVINYETYHKAGLKITEIEDPKRNNDSVLLVFNKNVYYELGNYQDGICVKLNNENRLTNSSFGVCSLKTPRPLKQLQITFIDLLAYNTEPYQVKNPNANVLIVDYDFPNAPYYTRVFGFNNEGCRYKPDSREDVTIFKENCTLSDTLIFETSNKFHYAKWALKKVRKDKKEYGKLFEVEKQLK